MAMNQPGCCVSAATYSVSIVFPHGSGHDARYTFGSRDTGIWTLRIDKVSVCMSVEDLGMTGETLRGGRRALAFSLIPSLLYATLEVASRRVFAVGRVPWMV